MKTRILSAIVMIVLVIVCIGFSPIVRTLFFIAVGVLCTVDMCKALGHMDIIPMPVIGGLFIWGSGVIYFFDLDAIWMMAAYMAAIILSFLVAIISEKHGCKGALATLAICIYPLYPISLIIDIGLQENWLLILVTGALATVACDSFALFGGMLLGKHKVAPRVSPNKTIEGCLSGLIFSGVAGVVLSFVFSGYGIPMWIFVVVCMISSTVGQIGDLAASLIKRMAGVKDFSKLIPGHGGVMDRVDSLLFALPTAYVCMLLFGVI